MTNPGSVRAQEVGLLQCAPHALASLSDTIPADANATEPPGRRDPHKAVSLVKRWGSHIVLDDWYPGLHEALVPPLGGIPREFLVGTLVHPDCRTLRPCSRTTFPIRDAVIAVTCTTAEEGEDFRPPAVEDRITTRFLSLGTSLSYKCWTWIVWTEMLACYLSSTHPGSTVSYTLLHRHHIWTILGAPRLHSLLPYEPLRSQCRSPANVSSLFSKG